jgi:hypothetical protein
MEHKWGNEAYIISHWGARSRGYKRREGARARARERVSACVRLYLNVNILCQRAPHLSLHRNVSVLLRALGRPWTSPFIDARRCPTVQRGVAMRYVAGEEVP